jgi:hypothetical protein
MNINSKILSSNQFALLTKQTNGGILKLNVKLKAHVQENFNRLKWITFLIRHARQLNIIKITNDKQILLY